MNTTRGPARRSIKQEGIRRFQDKLASGHYAAHAVTRCLCGGEDFAVLDTKERDGLDFRSLLCRRCGLVHTDPRLDEASLPEFYDSEYYPIGFDSLSGANAANLATTNVQPYQGHIIYDRCAQWLPDSPVEVLEIGCGCGLNLYQFGRRRREARLAAETVGVEYSASHRATARQRYGVTHVFDSVEAIPGNKTFDVIILSHIVEHFSDIDYWLKKIALRAHEDTLVYIEVPGIENLPDRPDYAFSLRGYFHFPHLHCFTLGSLRHLLSRYGFVLLHGDEHVRAVFRYSGQARPEAPDPEAAARILACADRLAAAPYAWLHRAIVAARAGRLDEASECADAALASHPDHPWVHAILADVSVRRGQAGQAVAAARQALALGHPLPLPLLALVIDQHIGLRNWVEAVAACDAYAAAAPEWDRLPMIRRARLERLRGDAALAVAIVRRIDDRNLTEPEAVLEEVRALEALGRLDEALTCLEPLRDQYGRNSELQYSLMSILLRLGDREKALTAFASIRAAAKSRDKWVLTKCALLFKEHGLYEEAFEALEAALVVDPDFFDVRLLKAGLHAVLLRCDEAVRQFEELLRDHPERPDIHFNIASAYQYVGRGPESKAALDALERLVPDHPGLANARAKWRKRFEPGPGQSATPAGG